MDLPTKNNGFPISLLLIRHAQSAGNIARDQAEAAGLLDIRLPTRDMDVPLSDLGKSQAQALGFWMKNKLREAKPDVIFSSPYLRAEQTAQIIQDKAGLSVAEWVVDERLREREFGGIGGLTHQGIVAGFPREAEMYKSLGKFYYRPPGGESWCDVVLRLRSFLQTLREDYSEKRVLVVCHGVVILCFRYLLEKMSETQILKIDRDHEIANASITSYQFNPPCLESFNFVAPITDAGAKVTAPSMEPENE